MPTKLERAVRLGLQLAKDTPMDEAVGIMIECLELVLDQNLGANSAHLGANSAPAPLLATPEPTPRPTIIEDLVPIGEPGGQVPANGSSAIADAVRKVRVWRAVEDLFSIVSEKAPPSISIVPEGRTDEITLIRTLVQVAGTYAGVTLSYRLAGVDPEVPYPKQSFWVTDENLAVEQAVDKMKSDARKMYRSRTGPIRQGIAAQPIRYVDGGTV